MRFDGLNQYRTGVLVPLSAVRTAENPGAGEFADLVPLASWCSEIGLDLIQLLPVNDSGGDSSPYSAVSAFALHPLYLRIQDLPELERLAEDERAAIHDAIGELRAEHSAHTRLDYDSLLAGKMAILEQLYASFPRDEQARRELEDFAAVNHWIPSYAIFKVLKARNDRQAWTTWPEHRDPTEEDIGRLWQQPAIREEAGFHVWLQMRLEEQFQSAAREITKLGVMLKGDLPILMNEDSADVWLHRDTFITDLRAGAPPDMFSHLGQNWDFPIYNWERMAENGYRWWKDRLRQADKFYSAYRLDHVLGFFRVWAIPAENQSGMLGHFVPSKTASRDRLHDAGLNDGRIRWLAEPHIPGEEIRAEFGDDSDEIIASVFEQIGEEDLYLFCEDVHGERALDSLDITASAREWLIDRYADRALIQVGEESFSPSWSFHSCTRYQQLEDREKASFEALVAELSAESEQIWEEQARRLLGFMCEETEMLPCAEDLGVIPNAVPRVLGDLGILGLRIPRWARLWDQPGQPFIPPRDFPFLTVCAPSVHDTTTLRQWWQEESALGDFWSALGLEDPVPEEFTVDTARTLIGRILETGSAICVLQIQDILALSDSTREPDVANERVNVPGTLNRFNWGYRMPVSVNELSAESALSETLAPMVEQRRRRSGGARRG